MSRAVARPLTSIIAAWAVAAVLALLAVPALPQSAESAVTQAEPKCTVPKLLNLSYSAARTKALAAGFVALGPDDGGGPVVIKEYPRAGTQAICAGAIGVDMGQHCTRYVPYVEGLSIKAAQDRITEADLESVVARVPGRRYADWVLHQSPGLMTALTCYGVVTLTPAQSPTQQP